MPKLNFLACALVVVTASFVWARQPPAAPESLWSWFGACDKKLHMGIEVQLDGKVIHRSTFPICPIKDRSEEVAKTVEFSFKGGHLFQGEYQTAASETIEGEVWQAGTDPGAILLGVSFSTKKQVLLNTIHVAKPYQESVSRIDPGLVVRTFPIVASK